MTIQDILDQKGRRVIAIAPNHTLDVVLATLIQNSVGALVVQNRAGDLLGIITERDLMREVYNGADLQAARVEDVMTRDLVTSHPDSDIEYVMAAMTEGRFRHMPIVDEAGLAGIVSIGDIVKAKLESAEEEVMLYKDFVTLDWRAS
ncbi:MAG: CBS domain-containing protein [Gemmatimonadota bacterium]|nr:CBS domain-containing protein [Gemmatimonadota bacterium]